MPSPNLVIPHVAASQNQKEVTINDAIDALDLAMTAALEIDVTAGGTIAVTEAEQRRNAAVVLTGTPAAAVTLQLPAVRNFLYVQNTTGQEVTVGGPGGGGTVPVGAGQRLLVYATGSDVLPIEAALGATDVTPGSYGDGGSVPRITVDAQGRIISVATLPVTGGGGGSSSGGHVSGATGTFGSGSTSAYATKGLLFVPDQPILVSHLRAYIDAAIIGEDNYAQIAEVSGITAADTVTAVLGTSATVASSSLELKGLPLSVRPRRAARGRQDLPAGDRQRLGHRHHRQPRRRHLPRWQLRLGSQRARRDRLRYAAARQRWRRCRTGAGHVRDWEVPDCRGGDDRLKPPPLGRTR